MKTLTSTKPVELRWNVARYDRAAELGWFRKKRVELIEGRVIQMPPQKEPHAVALVLARDAIAKAFGSGYVVRPQLPLRLGRASKPEPDLAVTPGSPRDSLRTGVPSTPVLILEISDTTLKFDRGRKASLYARHGISDYWILNLLDRQLEIHRNPASDPTKHHGYGYSHVQIISAGGTASPLALPGSCIKVADLLP